jgi:hypothetical protein
VEWETNGELLFPIGSHDCDHYQPFDFTTLLSRNLELVNRSFFLIEVQSSAALQQAAAFVICPKTGL